VGGGGRAGGAVGTGASSAGRAAQEPISDAEAARERAAREERLRASEERLRTLIRDICTGCDYGSLSTRTTTTNVVRVKG
jgi:hypothetical protein